MISGRLAKRVLAGPGARIVRITPKVLPPDGSASHLEGVVVGSEDEPATINARDISRIAAGGTFDPKVIDGAARARVVVFQTWLGVRDAQVLVRPTDGAVLSIDHGDAFGNTSDRSDPQVMVTPIPGVGDNVGKTRRDVMAAVQKIKSITDRNLIEDVSRVPSGEPWRSPVDRRLAIAEYLAFRRDRLQEVMEKWLSS